MMRRGVLALAVMALPLGGVAQNPATRLHRNLPANYPFESLPAGVVVPPMTRSSLAAAASGAAWSESQRPGDEILRPREAWSSGTRELDANTRSPAGTRLSYREVFTPSVSPFKRTQSFDAVDAQGRLFVRSPILRPIAVGALPTAGEGPTQRFTGDVNVELSPDRPTAIPSVAAESYIVGYRTTPQVSVAFFQDSAGNLFVRGARVATVRLTWIVAAPERMFVPRRIPSVSVSQVPNLLGVDAPSLPGFLRSDSPAVFTHHGVGAESTLDFALHRLTERFRGFRDAELPAAPSGSLYRALATGGVGACRHRAYAFALTAMALGVPSRFVGNEAHAWVEVQLPDNGWTRIDLGGWDVPLHEQGSPDRAPFVPDQPDPFPRPPEYTNGYSTRTAPSAAAPRPAPSPTPARATAEYPEGTPRGASSGPGSESSGAGAPGGASASGSGGAAQGVAAATGGARLTESVAEAGGESPAGQGGLAARSGSELGLPVRARTAIRLEEVTPVGRGAESPGFVRGTLVRCAGEAVDDDQRPVANLAVQVELLRDGVAVRVDRGARQSTSLGATTTGPDGRFEARVLLPVELGAGSYELRVRTPGDSRHLPSRSE